MHIVHISDSTSSKDVVMEDDEMIEWNVIKIADWKKRGHLK